jgi:hypothetical protein
MSVTNEKPFDGRANYSFDDEVETALTHHFEKFGVSQMEVARNFAIYARRVHLKRFLAHYELFRQTINVPGDIVELGVFRGASLMAWANFLEIRNMGDRQKKVIGFDNFKGFEKFSPEDGAEAPGVQKVIGGFDPSGFEEALHDAISIYDKDRFIPFKPRVELVKGDIEKTVVEYVQKNPGLRISLLHFDVDLYGPSKKALEVLWPLVSPGAVVAFDEYGIQPWEGESRAVDEFFQGRKVKLTRLDWSSNPGAYLVKE